MRLVFCDKIKSKLLEKYIQLFGGPGSGRNPEGGSDNKEGSASTNKSDSLPAEINDMGAYKADPHIGNEGLANETHDILTKMGLNPGNISVSETPSGTSRYISVPINKDGDRIKIRISDHSVENASRIANEVHLNHDNIGQQMQNIERAIHPDRYKTVRRTKQVRIASSYIKPDDSVVKGSEEDVGRTDYHIVTVNRPYDDYERKEPLKT